MLWYITAAYHWTSQTSRISEKLQKANEGHEGQIKGQTLSKIKTLYFFHFFGVIWCRLIRNWLWFEFLGHKGQKGRYDRSKLKITIEQTYGSKFDVPTLLMININAPHPILNRITKNNYFRAQKVSHRSEIFIKSKNCRNTK